MQLTLDPSSPESYQLFLRVKTLPTYRIRGRVAEFPDEYADRLGVAAPDEKAPTYKPQRGLFDYQTDISETAIDRKKFSVFADPGLGKTFILAEFARHCLRVLPKSRRVLWVNPDMVTEQSRSELERFYNGTHTPEIVRAAGLQEWLNGDGGRFGITNFEALKKGLKRGQLGALLIDECFAAGTHVDCVENGYLISKPIETILRGDKIINATGVDKVIATKRREVSHAVIVKAGTQSTCSQSHPFFTQRGWVCAQDLEPGDSILSARAAMRMVQQAVSSERYAWTEPVLQSVLLSEVANEPAATRRQGSQSEGVREAGQVEIEVVQFGRSEGDRTEGKDSHAESDGRSGGSREGVGDSESHEAQTFRAWWQWDWDDIAASDLVGCTWADLGDGVCAIAGPTTAGISDKLQARLSERRNESVHRSGWSVAPQPEEARREEGCDGDFVRVDSIEILERGHPELERLRTADGKLYFYDLEAARHPSYSVGGLLVHNSSVMKSHYGQWGRRLIDLGKGLEWKMCATGTPAPNDRIEYGNHAVFLDQFPNTNAFLARYFINRGQTQDRWVLKPHALEPFYRSLSHWSIFLTNPATYGWKDNVGNIPAIHTHISDVEMTDEQKDLVRKMYGQLMVTDPGGITKRGKLSTIAKGFIGKKQTVATHKYEAIADLVHSWPDESTIIWCSYDREQDNLEQTFPDAASLRGTTRREVRLEAIEAFKAGERKILISKPKILGFGLNLQRATRQVFSTLKDSYEEYFQCVKRSNRVGSTRPLSVHIPVMDIERPMIETVLRKADRVQSDTETQEKIFRKSMG